MNFSSGPPPWDREFDLGEVVRQVERFKATYGLVPVRLLVSAYLHDRLARQCPLVEGRPALGGIPVFVDLRFSELEWAPVYRQPVQGPPR